MWKKTIASAVVRQFADERRRVVSDWRILVHCRRLAQAENAPLPDERKAAAVGQELIHRGDITPVEGVGLSGVYVVDAPYANLLEASEEQVLQEAEPWAALSHLTALAYHGLTDLIPSRILASSAGHETRERPVPLGTTPEDWSGLEFPKPKRPRRIGETEIVWAEIKHDFYFGISLGYSAGSPVRVTDVERTLIDSLRAPEKSGGVLKVFEAWKMAEGMDVERLADYTDRFQNQTLRQRVGFLLQTLNRPNPRSGRWREHLLRGGSVRLAAGQPYSERFSPEWNLSLNVPDSALGILDGR